MEEKTRTQLAGLCQAAPEDCRAPRSERPRDAERLGQVVIPRSHITVQNLDRPVSRTLLRSRSRTKTASLPNCEYHMLRLRLR